MHWDRLLTEAGPIDAPDAVQMMMIRATRQRRTLPGRTCLNRKGRSGGPGAYSWSNTTKADQALHRWKAEQAWNAKRTPLINTKHMTAVCWWGNTSNQPAADAAAPVTVITPTTTQMLESRQKHYCTTGTASPREKHSMHLRKPEDCHAGAKGQNQLEPEQSAPDSDHSFLDTICGRPVRAVPDVALNSRRQTGTGRAFNEIKCHHKGPSPCSTRSARQTCNLYTTLEATHSYYKGTENPRTI
jgi:hypothetical protein